MSEKSTAYAKGDWIVHAFYGVGQIKGIEKKKIGETETKYFKVTGKNSTFFVPVDNADNERIRPIASKYMLRKAINILKSPAEKLEDDHNQRKRQITERMNDCSLTGTAQLVRDLKARQIEFGLNDHEETTLAKLTDRLVKEWSITQEIDQESALKKFEMALSEGATT